MPSDDDVLRIMISTDNHLGVWERDEVRKHDSFNAFEEVLQKANDLDVDMVLLGGDLFHENKPSRHTVVRAIAALKKHCLQKDRPIQFKILSDTTKNFVSGTANYQDPSLTVGLPVFTIHGNHDDPTGADNLSAVDILSSCGLVNYFGKVLLSGAATGVEGTVEIAPVLLTKGSTQVALYGLGNIRDERLGRLFRTAGCVQWKNDIDLPDCAPESWFNVFVLHQNRVQHGPRAKNCVTEDQLPAWLDLVVWGHEHECIPEAVEAHNPEAKAAGADLPFILQPGSTVATALSEGEACKKHFFVLEIMGTRFRVQKHALESQRPFVYELVCLKEVTQPKPLRAEDQEGITAFLEAKVNDMIKKATGGITGAEAKLPLIRLKVDYTGFTTINAQRFGQKFVGKVANPHDILTWTKQLSRRVKDEGGGAGGMLDADLLRPEALDQARIEDLIQENLQDKLKLLTEEELGLALTSFVDKDEKTALSECVSAELAARMRGAAIKKVLPNQLSDSELLDQLITAVVEDRDDKDAILSAKAEVAGGPGLAAGAGGDGDDMDYEPAGTSKAKAGTQRGSKAATQTTATGRGRGRGRGKAAEKAAPAGRGKGRQLNMLEAFSLQASQRNTAAAPAAGTGAGTGAGADEDGDDDFGTNAPVATTRGTGRAGASQPRARATQSGKKHARDSDDDEVEEEEEETGVAAGRGKRAATTRRTTQRATAQASKRAKVVESDDEAAISDDGDDDYVEVASSDAESLDEIDDDDDEGRGGQRQDKEGFIKRGSKKAAGGSSTAKRAGGSTRATAGKKGSQAGGSSRSTPKKATASKSKVTKSPASTMVTSLAGGSRGDEDAITIGSTSEEDENQGRAATRQAAPSQRPPLATARPGAGTQASGPTQKGGRVMPSSLTAAAPQSTTQRAGRNWGQAR